MNSTNADKNEALRLVNLQREKTQQVFREVQELVNEMKKQVKLKHTTSDIRELRKIVQLERIARDVKHIMEAAYDNEAYDVVLKL